MAANELPFKESDFSDGMTKDEKFNLACDLFMLSNSIQSHDESLFHMIASVSVLKSLLIEAGIVTEEKYGDLIATELDKILDMIKKHTEEDKKEAE